MTIEKEILLTFVFLIDYQRIVGKVRRWSSGQEPRAREKKIAAGVKGRSPSHGSYTRCPLPAENFKARD